MSTEPHIYVDSDACPVKSETVKVATRHGLPVTFVANAWMQTPRGSRIRMEVDGLRDLPDIIQDLFDMVGCIRIIKHLCGSFDD